MRRLAVLIPGLALCACASAPKPVPVATVPPPAPVAQAASPSAASVRRVRCVPSSLPPAPKYPDTDANLRAAAEAADRYQLLAAGRLLRIRRLAELERVVDGCRATD